ncbi:Aste57867_24518 [Aphanomyces stellatus]|uniref:Aste57867_24518 protein n=1 Tax=Aphanomyces stellatus TaxID=120398 RepID=A0A485LQK1_9STRA|nr:hypothetical protein As57867_024441 [Aphanomyces stellatus]VFU01157.1 Aste57867_24518 [Aphanomyces stellatus]
MVKTVDHLELSHDQRVAFGARTHAHLRHALDTLSLGQKMQYGQKYLDKMGLEVFSDGDSTVCTGILNTTMPDIVYAMYASTTKETQTVSAILLGQAYDDAGVLDTFETRSPDDMYRFGGAKHVSLARKGLFSKAKERRAVYLEAMGTLRDDDDDHVRLYHLVEYIDMAHYETTCAIRPICTSLTLLHANPDDVKSVLVWAKASYYKETPSYLTQMHQPAAYWQRTLALSSLAVSRRLVESTSLVQHWVPNADCKKCSVCDVGFKTLRPKHHCRCCGEMMCHMCSIHIQSPAVIHKYCTKCVLKSRSVRGSRRNNASRKHTTASISSSSPDFPTPPPPMVDAHGRRLPSPGEEDFLRTMQAVRGDAPPAVVSSSTMKQSTKTGGPTASALDSMKALQESIAAQSTLLSTMRETLEKTKHNNAARITSDSIASTAGSYVTVDESVLDSEGRRFEYMD